MAQSPNRLTRLVIALATVLAFTFGFSIVSQILNPSSASAATINCGWPRCTLYLNKAESRGFAYGSYVPSAPAPIVGALIVLRQGLGWFARYYVDRGYCLGFQVSAIPWETQSLFPYRC